MKHQRAKYKISAYFKDGRNQTGGGGGLDVGHAIDEHALSQRVATHRLRPPVPQVKRRPPLAAWCR